MYFTYFKRHRGDSFVLRWCFRVAPSLYFSVVNTLVLHHCTDVLSVLVQVQGGTKMGFSVGAHTEHSIFIVFGDLWGVSIKIKHDRKHF